jgi:predicted alpha/beta-hydrolase family hydrolase
VALAFPLHPPGRPELSRLAELDAAGVPVLVVQGARDPFGMPPQGADREVVVIAGADHSLKRDVARIGATVAAFVTTVAARANVEA